MMNSEATDNVRHQTANAFAHALFQPIGQNEIPARADPNYELRQTLRSQARTAGFAAATIGILAIGLTANTIVRNNRPPSRMRSCS